MQAVQMDLFGVQIPERIVRYRGVTGEAQKQKSLRERIVSLMKDGKRRTLHTIHDCVGGDLGGALSARVRELRRPEYGGWKVECERNQETGYYEYWIHQ